MHLSVGKRRSALAVGLGRGGRGLFRGVHRNGDIVGVHHAQLFANIFVGQIGIDALSPEQVHPVLQLVLLLGELGQDDALLFDRLAVIAPRLKAGGPENDIADHRQHRDQRHRRPDRPAYRFTEFVALRHFGS